MSADDDRRVELREEQERHERGRSRDNRFARLYGAQPWHLLVLLGLGVVSAYAASRLLDDLPVLLRITLWFVGAAVVWDLLLGPAYAVVDAVLRRTVGRVRASGVSPLNYVRVPLALSSLLLVVWAPLVLQRSEGVYQAKSGLRQDPYLERWLAVTAVLLLASAGLYAVAVLRARRSSRG